MPRGAQLIDFVKPQPTSIKNSFSALSVNNVTEDPADMPDKADWPVRDRRKRVKKYFCHEACAEGCCGVPAVPVVVKEVPEPIVNSKD